MLILWFRLTGLLVLVCTTIITFTQLIGHYVQPNPVLNGFISGCEGRAIPCWNGIVPGVTSFQEAADLLRLRGYQVQLDQRFYLDRLDLYGYSPDSGGCDLITFASFPSIGNPTIKSFMLVDCPSFSVGDVLLHLGEPTQIGMCATADVPVYSYDRRLNIFPDPHVQQRWLSPHQTIKRIALVHRFDEVPPTGWYGFVPRWRYAQLVQSETICLPM
jgi:hypothetical protein